MLCDKSVMQVCKSVRRSGGFAIRRLKGSTYFMRICNPPQARMLLHDFGNMKSLRLRIANPL